MGAGIARSFTNRRYYWVPENVSNAFLGELRAKNRPRRTGREGLAAKDW